MGRKPHICHYLYGFAPGGAEVRTTIFLNALGAEYRHTIVTATNAFGCLDLLSPDVEVDTICLDDVKSAVKMPMRIRAILRDLNPDLACIYNWTGIDGAIASVLSGFRPWVVILDGFGAEEANGELWRRKLTRRFAYRRADAVVVVSQSLERLAEESWKIDAPRILRIPNGIDTGFWSPGSGADVRARFGIPDDGPLVGTIAHARPEKDPVRLLRAFAGVAGEFPRARLMYVGGRPDARLAAEIDEVVKKEGIEDRVHFAGRVDNPRDYYRALDVFALTSRTEQMPMSVAEAMACGKPVIATDVGETRRMVCNANTEFVFPLDDDAAYVAGLRKLVADADLRRAIGEANRRTAVQRLDQRRMVDAYRSLFGRLTDPDPEPAPEECAKEETWWGRLMCRMTTLTRRAVSGALYYTGVLDAVSWFRCRFRKERAIILGFHCVSDSNRPDRRYFRDGMNIDSHQFRTLLKSLRRRYRIVSLDDLVAELEDPPQGRKPAIAITFDDGYRSVHQVALPILRDLEVPATVFLSTDYIGTGRLLWWDEVQHLVESAPGPVLELLGSVVPDAPDRANAAVTWLKAMPVGQREEMLQRLREAAGDVPPPVEPTMLNWDEVRELHDAGVRIGSHTASHRYLDTLSREEVQRELREASAKIEQEVGVMPNVVAYPDGRFNEAVVEETRAVGFGYAVSTISGMNAARCDRFRLRRQDGGVPVAGQERGLSFPVMWAEILGVWDLLYFRRRRVPERFSTFRPVVRTSS